MDGRLNRRNKAEFSVFSNVVWTRSLSFQRTLILKDREARGWGGGGGGYCAWLLIERSKFEPCSGTMRCCLRKNALVSE